MENGWEHTVDTMVPFGRWQLIVSQLSHFEMSANQSTSSPVQAAAFRIRGQHDEAVGYQDGTVLEDMGVPDGCQEGCMEVSRSLVGKDWR